MNFLEQLVSEWYRYRGYYVNENTKVGKRKKGGYEGELDLVAFHPETGELVHVETSMDALSWEKRRAKFKQKFERGRREIPALFPHVDIEQLRQEVVFGYPRSTRDEEKLGPRVKVYLMPDLIEEIRIELSRTTVETGVVPENFPLLRAMQFALDYGGFLTPAEV